MQRVSSLVAAGALTLGPFVLDEAIAASLFVVHGTNASTFRPRVDVNVVLPDGSELCDLTDLRFGNIEKPIQVDQVGIYGIEIYLTDGNCDNRLLVADELSISLDETALVLFQLDGQNTPVIRKYTLDMTALDEDEGRVSAIHAAVAGAMDVEVVDRDNGNDVVATSLNVRNGDQTFPLVLAAGPYRVELLDPASGDRLARRNVTVDPGEIGVGIAVGSALDGTLEVLRLIIDPDE
jgi:hypothetical protein